MCHKKKIKYINLRPNVRAHLSGHQISRTELQTIMQSLDQKLDITKLIELAMSDQLIRSPSAQPCPYCRSAIILAHCLHPLRNLAAPTPNGPFTQQEAFPSTMPPVLVPCCNLSLGQSVAMRPAFASPYYVC